jgi:ketosteroid isomerase-like protein
MSATRDPRALLERLLPAVNDHDLEALAACFATDYVNVNPSHPLRDFQGAEQVRRNWSHIFAEVPDIHARVLRSAVDGDTLWTEWEMSGARLDGGAVDLRGVFIYGVADGQATWARMFLEPVEQASGDIDAAVRRDVGDTSAHSQALT